MNKSTINYKKLNNLNSKNTEEGLHYLNIVTTSKEDLYEASVTQSIGTFFSKCLC